MKNLKPVWIVAAFMASLSIVGVGQYLYLQRDAAIVPYEVLADKTYTDHTQRVDILVSPSTKKAEALLLATHLVREHYLRNRTSMTLNLFDTKEAWKVLEGTGSMPMRHAERHWLVTAKVYVSGAEEVTWVARGRD